MQPMHTNSVKRSGGRRRGHRGPSLGVLGIWAAAVMVMGIEPAHAGGKSGSDRSGSGSRTLARTTSAVRTHTSAPPASGGSGGTTSPRPVTSDFAYEDGYYCATCPPYVGGPAWAHGPPVARPQLSVSVGMQSVEGSDGAVSGAIHLRSGGLGLALEGAQYFERGLALDGSDLIRMDVWSLNAAGRVLRIGAGELWVAGGVGGSGSTEFERLMGLVIGGELTHPIGGDMMLRGGARYYVLEQETQIAEAYAHFGVWFLSVGYRALRFNVGPPLHGPQVGVHWQL